VTFTAKEYGPVNAVLWHEPKCKEPIYLVTNMDSPQMACRYYKKRFKIEKLFGDLKSRGFNIHRTKVSEPERLSNLLMLAAALSFCCFALAFAHPNCFSTPNFVAKTDATGQFSHWEKGHSNIALTMACNFASIFQRTSTSILHRKSVR
jgi:hypothetical protein